MNFEDFSADKKRLISNFFSLSSVEVANYIFPLITLPYLVRILGPEKFGLVAFAQAFVQYFVLLTDYGFNLSATRNISIHRKNKEKVSRIFSSVMTIKIALAGISLLIISAVVLTVPKFRPDWVVYLFTFGMVVGNIFFPIWFFQGMEKMKFIAALNFLAKTIFVAAIFIFVRVRADYILVPLLTSLGFIIAGIISLWIVSQRFKVRYSCPDLKDIRLELKEGWHIFISTAAISLYTTSNTFILGLLTNNTSVAYYSTGEKIVKAVQRLWTPVSQTIFPFFAKLYSDNKERAQRALKKILFLAAVLTFGLSIAGFLSAKYLTLILLGERFLNSVLVIKILIFTIFAIGINNILGIQGIIAFGLSKYFAVIVTTAGIVHIALLFILIPLYGYVGTAIAALTTELFICILEYIMLKRKQII